MLVPLGQPQVLLERTKVAAQVWQLLALLQTWQLLMEQLMQVLTIASKVNPVWQPLQTPVKVLQLLQLRGHEG
jgi:hypothetical protein